MNPRVVITGASGFLGQAVLSKRLPGYQICAVSRKPVAIEGVDWIQSPELSGSADWRRALEGADGVIHLAGRVHLPGETDASAYVAENQDGTLKLAQDAIAAGVRRFLFVSTAKVLGDESGSSPLSESAPANPADAYAKSKLAAERALMRLQGALQVTILRPPLVYGPGVRANFLALFSAVARGLPLPLASVKNRRSLVGIDNLVGAISASHAAPVAGGRIYHVADRDALSTPELIRGIAEALHRPARLFRFPPTLLEACGAAIGRSETIKRLTRSLELDHRAIEFDLGWTPPRSFESILSDTARWYRSVYGEAD